MLQQVVFVVLTAVQTVVVLCLGRMPGSAHSFPGCVSLVLIELLWRVINFDLDFDGRKVSQWDMQKVRYKFSK